MSSVSDSAAQLRASQSEEGIATLTTDLSLHFGGSLSSVRVAWRLAGPAGAPVVAVLGGISAGRQVFASPPEQGWWKDIVGPNKALDANAFRILGIDFLGGSGATTGPRAGQTDFPSISAFDQATVLSQLLPLVGIRALHAIVGASYGGMVALAFAERFPHQVERIVAISAADRAHPLATAWRSVQRETVRVLAAKGEGAAGLKLARALAMATYRSPQEFAQRFTGAAIRKDGILRMPVESYLYARGQAYADSYVPEAFVCLSESIDLHTVEPDKIRVPATLVAVVEDQLVPLADIRSLASRLCGPVKLVELSSLYGHDAFLKEADALKKVFSEAL
jgi:homoserine O-acetyltransferase